MKTLVLCNDKWHPGKIIEDGLSFLENIGFKLTFNNDISKWDEEITPYQVIIIAKINQTSSDNISPWMTLKFEHKLEEFVANGGTLLSLHSGTSEYNECLIYTELINGFFIHHPEQCNVTYCLEKGKSFSGIDEHYFMEMHNKDEVEIFLTSSSVHGIQPAGWRKNYKKGKVIVLTPGHNSQIYQEVLFKDIILWNLQN